MVDARVQGGGDDVEDLRLDGQHELGVARSGVDGGCGVGMHVGPPLLPEGACVFARLGDDEAIGREDASVERSTDDGLGHVAAANHAQGRCLLAHGASIRLRAGDLPMWWAAPRIGG